MLVVIASFGPGSDIVCPGPSKLSGISDHWIRLHGICGGLGFTEKVGRCIHVFLYPINLLNLLNFAFKTKMHCGQTCAPRKDMRHQTASMFVFGGVYPILSNVLLGAGALLLQIRINQALQILGGKEKRTF